MKLFLKIFIISLIFNSTFQYQVVKIGRFCFIIFISFKGVENWGFILIEIKLRSIQPNFKTKKFVFPLDNVDPKLLNCDWFFAIRFRFRKLHNEFL